MPQTSGLRLFESCTSGLGSAAVAESGWALLAVRRLVHERLPSASWYVVAAYGDGIVDIRQEESDDGKCWEEGTVRPLREVYKYGLSGLGHSVAFTMHPYRAIPR